MYDETQLMRGGLEGCILKTIEQHIAYGYEILMNMKGAGWIDITEGTLYPILLRLEKLRYIRTEEKGSPLGSRHKYYQITAEGRVYLRDSYTKWSKLAKTIDRPFGGGVNGDW